MQELQFASRRLVKCFDNVFIASHQEHVVYAGYQRLQVGQITNIFYFSNGQKNRLNVKPQFFNEEFFPNQGI